MTVGLDARPLVAHVMYCFDVFHDLSTRLSLQTQISNDQQKRGHSVEISDRFPTHGLVNVEKNAIPSIKPLCIYNRLPKQSPCAL